MGMVTAGWMAAGITDRTVTPSAMLRALGEVVRLMARAETDARVAAWSPSTLCGIVS